MQILVVDDDAAVREACCEIANRRGYAAWSTESLEEARNILKGSSVDVLLLDLKAPIQPGMELLDEMRAVHPRTSIVVMTAFATVTSAVAAMRNGAAEFLTKPFASDELAGILDRVCERRSMDMASRRLRERLRAQNGLGAIIGRSPEMEKLYRILSKVAQSTHPVLILGESGTGKELVARAIHAHGPHSAKPFIAVDCSSLVPTLIESELFGYVKGAFTGAVRSKDGLLASAEGGTIFLDEVGELPLDLQAKLLRALQEKEIRPVGASHTVAINVRILAATNRDLAGMVEQGRFRKDLYYRLNVVNLRIPALRERRQDIPHLVAHFLERLGREKNTTFTLDDEALRTIVDYDWPGNVRELEHVIERACALSSDPVLHLDSLSTQLQNFHYETRRAAAAVVPAREPEAARLEITPLAELEKQAILSTIRQLNGDKLKAARLLGIGKTTLYRKLKEYGLAAEAPEPVHRG
jgi:DNA-binding NtrC family response regulator